MKRLADVVVWAATRLDDRREHVVIVYFRDETRRPTIIGCDVVNTTCPVECMLDLALSGLGSRLAREGATAALIAHVRPDDKSNGKLITCFGIGAVPSAWRGSPSSWWVSAGGRVTLVTT